MSPSICGGSGALAVLNTDSVFDVVVWPTVSVLEQATIHVRVAQVQYWSCLRAVADAMAARGAWEVVND